jgi:hypothetical protein
MGIDGPEARSGSPWTWVCAVFAVGLALRILLILALGLDDEPYRGEVQRMAWTLAKKGYLGDPYQIPTGPSAHSPPVYPLLVAPVYAAFEEADSADRLLLFLNAALASLGFSLLPVIAPYFGMSAEIGLVAGLTGALLPFHLLAEVRGGEAPLGALAVMGLFVLGTTLRKALWSNLVYLGVACGVAVLVNPAFMTSVVCLGWLWTSGDSARTRLLRWAAVGLAAGLTLLPWTVRNYRVLGIFVPVRSNFGIEFRMSNHDLACADMVGNFAVPESRRCHPSVDPGAAAAVCEQGEAVYNRRLLREALDWAQSRPLHFIRLTVRRMLNFWVPPTPEPLRGVALGFLAVAGWIGLLWACRHGLAGAAAQVTVWLTFPGVYYLVQSAPRYRYPLTWAFLLYATWAVAQLVQMLSGRPGSWRTVPGRYPRCF